MCTGKEYLELVSLFVQAKPPKPRELRPCNQHELLLQLLCRRRELTKNQLADLLWNVTNGPKKKNLRRKAVRWNGRPAVGAHRYRSSVRVQGEDATILHFAARLGKITHRVAAQAGGSADAILPGLAGDP